MKLGLKYALKNSFVETKGKTTTLYVPKRFISAHKIHGSRLAQFKRGFVFGAKKNRVTINKLRVVGYKHHEK